MNLGDFGRLKADFSLIYIEQKRHIIEKLYNGLNGTSIVRE